MAEQGCNLPISLIPGNNGEGLLTRAAFSPDLHSEELLSMVRATSTQAGGPVWGGGGCLLWKSILGTFLL